MMSDKPLPWFRYYTETATDIKFTRIARECEISKAEAVGTWSLLLCLAAQSPIRGKLYVTVSETFNETDISDTLCFSETKTALLLRAFTQMGMIHQDENGAYCITNWDKRQFERDISTERVRRYRENRQMKRDETVSETPPDTESESESDTESEKIKTQEAAASSEPPPTPSPPKQTRVAVVTERDAEIIFQTITGMVCFPSGSRSQDFDRIQAIAGRHKAKTTDYLRPFFEAWLARGYNRANTAWLDWAVSGEIPKKRDNVPKNGAATRAEIDKLYPPYRPSGS